MQYQKGDIVRLKKAKGIKAKLRGKEAKIIEVRPNFGYYMAKIGNHRFYYSIHPWMIAYKLKKKSANKDKPVVIKPKEQDEITKGQRLKELSDLMKAVWDIDDELQKARIEIKSIYSQLSKRYHDILTGKE